MGVTPHQRRCNDPSMALLCGGSLRFSLLPKSAVMPCNSCDDTGRCPHCGGGSLALTEASKPKHQCCICLSSGECLDCATFDPMNPVLLYQLAVGRNLLLAEHAAMSS